MRDRARVPETNGMSPLSDNLSEEPSAVWMTRALRIMKQPPGRLYTVRAIRCLQEDLVFCWKILCYCIAVADALGLRVPPYAGKLDYYRFLAGSGALAGFRRSLFLRLFGFANRRIKSSSLQSLERGRRTEIDYFNGYIEKRGREAGVPTPINSKITAMVKEIESGKRSISPSNLSVAGA
jgi:hypothetical protein